MLLEMIRRNMRIDAVVFADTTMEFPPMYEHIDRVEQFLKAERGIPVTRLRAEYSFEQFMFDTMKGNTEYSTPGYGWPNISVRWCTWALKVQMIQAFSRALDTRPYHYIGFAADETKRLKRKSNQHPMKRYPLVEWGVTEAEALAACYREGYTWDGLYEHFSRVSCWCCPLQNLKELRTLRELYPEIWAELRRLDDRAIAQFGQDNAFGQFRPKESIRMLELRFDFEKEWAFHQNPLPAVKSNNSTLAGLNRKTVWPCQTVSRFALPHFKRRKTLKHKFINRAITLLLAMVCVMGLLPLSAFAAGLSEAPASITQKSSDYMKIGGKSVRYKAASSVINNVGLPYVFNEHGLISSIHFPHGISRSICSKNSFFFVRACDNSSIRPDTNSTAMSYSTWTRSIR